MAGKHIPQRTCIGCREVQGKRQMVRIVRSPEGRAHLDPTGKQPGRGAYLHAKLACWQAALTGGRLAHALKMTHLSEADRTELQAYMTALPKDDEPAA
jgi:predicted RNA-binding protein YlxR (DUF448 family)